MAAVHFPSPCGFITDRSIEYFYINILIQYVHESIFELIIYNAFAILS